MIYRKLTSILQNSPKSSLILGPRQVGISTLCKNLKPELIINLANQKTYLDHLNSANLIKELIAAKNPEVVFIDEIQRIPSLLNTIQDIIDNSNLKFLLTGSSARKLRRGKANLLPGRLFTYHLGGLCAAELNYEIDTPKALSFGCLPGVYISNQERFQKKLLSSYTSTYLKEEIQAEALTRNLEGFVRFLNVAGEWSGKSLDYSKLSRQAKVPRQSCIRYFEILEDTLIATRVPSLVSNEDADVVKHAKFYFFDTGVLNAILGNHIVSPDRKGLLFEHLIVNQILSSAAAQDIELKLNYFRTRGGAEIDLVFKLENKWIALEIKSSTDIDKIPKESFKTLEKELNSSIEKYILYSGSVERKHDNIWILPWQKALKSLGL